MPDTTEGFDGGAAITRSLLGWGVVAGPFYLTVGVVQGMNREGFSFWEHALSLLMLGEGGWAQSANLIVTGMMVLAAAAGFIRGMSSRGGARTSGLLVGLYGVAMIGSGIFPPDPVDGFPDPASTAASTISGLMHLALGGVGFLALAAAALATAGWLTRQEEGEGAAWSRLAGVVVLVAFLGGAALSSGPAGVVLLWTAVVTGWVWLATTSIRLYKKVPHPDLEKRSESV